MLKGILSLILLFGTVKIFAENSNVNPVQNSNSQSQCQEVLHWLYKDMTLQNLELSYQRSFQKFLYSIYFAHQKTKKKYRNIPELAQVFNTLKEIDERFKNADLLASNKTVWWSSWLNRNNYVSEKNLASSMKVWMDFQKSNPQFFKDMDENYKLDAWDMQTMNVLDEIQNYQNNKEINEQTLRLARLVKATKANLLDNLDFSPKAIEKSLKRTQNLLSQSLNQIGEDAINEFSNICSKNAMALFITRNNYVCPINDQSITNPFENLNSQLNSLSQIIEQTNLLSIDEKPKPELEIIDYTYTFNPEATFCKRPMEMISSLVIHHSATRKTITPAEVNQIHLNNSSDGDPWYMIGYNYLISESYQGATSNNPVVIKGRDAEIKGAHAGGYTLPISNEERQFYEQFDIQCGNDSLGFQSTPLVDQLDEQGGISGNLISLGIVILGNYDTSEPVTLSNSEMIPKQYISETPDIPNDASLRKAAELACQLQKNNPRITKFFPHNYFKNTKCPGDLVLYFETIKNYAKELGCEFTYSISKGDNL